MRSKCHLQKVKISLLLRNFAAKDATFTKLGSINEILLSILFKFKNSNLDAPLLTAGNINEIPITAIEISLLLTIITPVKFMVKIEMAATCDN